ncbi:MAG TPA: hypothetical protein VF268_01655, partial [Gammaproteobacteria bacterium]
LLQSPARLQELLRQEAFMSNGYDLVPGSKIHDSITQNISHNLEIAEKCFRCLISMLGGDGHEMQGKRSFIAENISDLEKILELCAANAQLIESVHDLLLDGIAAQPSANIEHSILNDTASSYPETYAEDDHNLNRKFRENIVDLMILSVQCWEQCAKKNKIELAEESKIWRISVDGGRLRVRSMDRYLCVTKLPKMPRWRDVLKTAYFVLDSVKCDSPIKKKLEKSLDRVLGIVRERSLRQPFNQTGSEA